MITMLKEFLNANNIKYHNEDSLKLELTIFLRNKLPEYYITTEVNVYGVDKDNKRKRCDICISKDSEIKSIIELKFITEKDSENNNKLQGIENDINRLKK